MVQLVLLYLGAANVTAFALFAADKRRAALDLRRIPERTLLGWAALGGVFGAVAAQQLLRHKTRKEPFRTWLGGVLMCWVVAGLALSALAVG